MREPIAYWNGQIVPFSSVSISPSDSGFVLGTTVAEQLRTFRGQVFRLPDHLARLAASLEVTGVVLPESSDRLAQISQELAAHNHALLAPGDDLGLAILVTPGTHGGYGAQDAGRPTVLLHTYPLPFHLWHEKYHTGQALIVPSVRQVPQSSWPSALKCRSRMHYYLADREAHAIQPGARALLLDIEGHVSEASTANILMFRVGQGLLSPYHHKVLPGVSLAEAVELAEPMGESLSECDLTPKDICEADEVFLTSTPLCLLPVVSLDRRKIGTGRPGNLFGRLIRAWSDEVGVDIAAQARQFAVRN